MGEGWLLRVCAYLRVLGHLLREERVRTGESARSSGLPAAIAKSPAVTVRDKSSQESGEGADCLLLVGYGRRGRAGGGGS
jgi:hypothetical protein